MPSRWKFTLELYLALLVSPLLSAATGDLPMARPEAVGLSTERLTRVRAMIQRYLDREQISGAVCLIARRGRVVHFEAQGFMDVDSRKPMQKDTLFGLASMTKPITSVAAMMLLEEGKFQLNDPVSRFIPEFKTSQHPPGFPDTGDDRDRGLAGRVQRRDSLSLAKGDGSVCSSPV